MKKSRPWLIAGSVLSFLTSLYCGLWLIQTASLDSGYCGDRFSLFAEEIRCRQGHVAMLLAAFFFVALHLLGLEVGATWAWKRRQLGWHTNVCFWPIAVVCFRWPLTTPSGHSAP